MEVPGGKMINLIFFGLSELEDVLSLDEPLKQRVAMRIRLTALSESDINDYIIHRIRIAGGQRAIFTDAAIKTIGQYSKGLPRLINTICDNALLEGFLVKSENIDEEIIRNVAVDLGLNGIPS